MERFAWKGKLRNWLPQYRENLTLAVPVMLSQVGQVVVQLADNAMVGRLGALPLAGVSFGGAVFVIFMFWGMGVSLGLTPLVGEAYAKRDLRGAAALFQNSLVLYAATGIVLL
ncbi:MATE family efflux transporter, partial [Alistipes ihumii]